MRLGTLVAAVALALVLAVGGIASGARADDDADALMRYVGGMEALNSVFQAQNREFQADLAGGRYAEAAGDAQTLKFLHAAIVAMDAPDLFQPAHDEMVKGYAEMDVAADLLWDGVASGNAVTVNQAAEHMKVGAEHVKQANDLLATELAK